MYHYNAAPPPGQGRGDIINLKFAGMVAEFAMILSDSENKGDASFEYILDTYKSLNDTDEYKDEFNQLVRMMAKRSL